MASVNRLGEGKVASDAVLSATPPPPVLVAEEAQCSSLVAASMCSYWAADLAHHITDQKCYASLHLEPPLPTSACMGGGVSTEEGAALFWGIGHFSGDSMQWRSQGFKRVS